MKNIVIGRIGIVCLTIGIVAILAGSLIDSGKTKLWVYDGPATLLGGILILIVGIAFTCLAVDPELLDRIPGFKKPPAPPQ